MSSYIKGVAIISILCAIYFVINDIQDAYADAKEKVATEIMLDEERQARNDDQKRHEQQIRDLDNFIAKTQDRREHWRQNYYLERDKVRRLISENIENIDSEDEQLKKWLEGYYPNQLD